MKKMFIALTLLIVSISLSAQTVSHTVQRGETIESIAQKYSVSVEDLKNANPDAKEYFYVGMKLSIPAKTVMETPEVVKPAPKKPQTELNMTEENKPQDTDVQEEGKGWGGGMELAYGFVPNGGYSFTARIGSNYYFQEIGTGFYAGARIGYELYQTKVETDLRITTKQHFVTVPLEAGYAISTENKNFAIIPFIAFDFNFRVASSVDAEWMKSYQRNGKWTNKDDYTEEIEKSTEKNLGGAVFVSFKPGIRLRLAGFNVGCAYYIPFREGEKGFAEVSIGFGF